MTMIKTNYSSSRCPKCEHTSFEVVQETPYQSSYILQFTRCSSCKSVVGVTEYFNIGALVKKIMDKLGIS